VKGEGRGHLEGDVEEPIEKRTGETPATCCNCSPGGTRRREPGSWGAWRRVRVIGFSLVGAHAFWGLERSERSRIAPCAFLTTRLTCSQAAAVPIPQSVAVMFSAADGTTH